MTGRCFIAKVSEMLFGFVRIAIHLSQYEIFYVRLVYLYKSVHNNVYLFVRNCKQTWNIGFTAVISFELSETKLYRI